MQKDIRVCVNIRMYKGLQKVVCYLYPIFHLALSHLIMYLGKALLTKSQWYLAFLCTIFSSTKQM